MLNHGVGLLVALLAFAAIILLWLLCIIVTMWALELVSRIVYLILVAIEHCLVAYVYFYKLGIEFILLSINFVTNHMAALLQPTWRVGDLVCIRPNDDSRVFTVTEIRRIDLGIRHVCANRQSLSLNNGHPMWYGSDVRRAT